MCRSLFERANRQASEELRRDRELHRVLPFVNAEYSLSFATLMFLWRFVLERKPTAILEFGSGVSTVLFSMYAKQRTCSAGVSVSVVSIEHDEGWAKATTLMLDQVGLASHVKIIHSPIVQRHFGHDVCPAYDVAPALLQQVSGGFDMCLIDGPPAKQFGRQGTFRIAHRHIACGATVLLDDAFRQHEHDCWTTWRQQCDKQLSRGRLALLPHGLRIGKWRGSTLVSEVENGSGIHPHN